MSENYNPSEHIDILNTQMMSPDRIDAYNYMQILLNKAFALGLKIEVLDTQDSDMVTFEDCNNCSITLYIDIDERIVASFESTMVPGGYAKIGFTEISKQLEVVTKRK